MGKRKSCSNCKRKLGDYHDYVLLKPCECIFCPECILVWGMNRKHRNLCCPNKSVCNDVPLSYDYHKRDEHSEETVANHQVIQHKFSEKDPVRYLQETNFQSYKETGIVPREGILCVAYSPVEDELFDGSVNVMMANFHLDEGPMTEKDRDKWVSIFTLLHSPLIGYIDTHSENSKKRDTPSDEWIQPSEWIKKTLYSKQTLLQQCMYSLSTGIRRLDVSKLHRDNGYQAQALSCCGVIPAIIERANSNGQPMEFQRMMGNLLRQSNAPRRLIDFLSKMRLSVHYTTLSRAVEQPVPRAHKKKFKSSNQRNL